MGQYANVPITCVIIPHGKLAPLAILTHWHIIQLIHYLDSNLKRKLYLCTPKEN